MYYELAHIHMGKKKNTKIQKTDGTENKLVDTSPKVHQRSKINFELSIKERTDYTEKQMEFVNLVLERQTQIVFLSGPAGTAKSYLSIYAGLKLMNKRSISDIMYIRSIVESASKSLGSLPGDANEKLDPFLMPLQDKLDELLDVADINALLKEERAVGMPVNYLRGASLNAKFILVDEAQNLDFRELTTVITRLGKFSKMVIAGDPGQSDLNGRSGFQKMFDLFNDESSRENGIHCFSFTKDDIVRSGILKYVIERIETAPRT